MINLLFVLYFVLLICPFVLDSSARVTILFFIMSLVVLYGTVILTSKETEIKCNEFKNDGFDVILKGDIKKGCFVKNSTGLYVLDGSRGNVFFTKEQVEKY